MSLKCTMLGICWFSPQKKKKPPLISLRIKKGFFDKILLRHDNKELLFEI